MGRSDGIDPDPSGPLTQVAPVHRVMIMQQMAWLGAPRRRLDQLPPHPGLGRVRGDVDVYEFPPSMGDECQDVQHLEGERLYRQQVGCP